MVRVRSATIEQRSNKVYSTSDHPGSLQVDFGLLTPRREIRVHQIHIASVKFVKE